MNLEGNPNESLNPDAKTANHLIPYSNRRDPMKRSTPVSLKNLPGVMDDIPTAAIGTFIDQPQRKHDFSNLKFRLCSESYLLPSSAQKKGENKCEFAESVLSKAEDSLKHEPIGITSVMVVDCLKYRLLKSHKNLELKAKAQENSPDDDLELIDCTEELTKLFNTDFSKLDEDQTLELIIANKKVSLAFQQLVWTCWFGQFPELEKTVINQIGTLIVHPLGNYVLQKVVERDPAIKILTEDFCKKMFSDLCQNQFASRVIQGLIETSEDFRQFATGFFRQNAWEFKDSMPAVYLLVAVIKCSSSDKELDFIREMVSTRLTEVMDSKYLKRVVVSYLIKVNKQLLPEMFSLFKLKQKTNLVKLFNDKFLSYIFLTFACREYQAAIDLLAVYIKDHFKQLLRTKHFMFVILKVITVETVADISHPNNSSIIDGLVKTLCQGNANDLKNLRFGYLCYTLLKSTNIVKSKSLAEFTAFLERELDKINNPNNNYKYNIRKALPF